MSGPQIVAEVLEAARPSPKPWLSMGSRSSANALFCVRWDMDCSAPGMQGFTSVTRGFETHADALAAAQSGMSKAFRATAMRRDLTGVWDEFFARNNPRHWRNKRRTAALAREQGL